LVNELHEGMVGGRIVHVSVTLKGSFADRFPDGRGEVEVAGGTAVGGLIAVLDLSHSSCIFVRHGTMIDRGTPLSDGDHVAIYPPMAGG
jgi:molybdopterin converting factor small subunit